VCTTRALATRTADLTRVTKPHWLGCAPSDGRYWARTTLPHSGHRSTGVVNTDASRSSTGVAAGQPVTGVDTPDSRFERPCGRNVDGTARSSGRSHRRSTGTRARAVAPSSPRSERHRCNERDRNDEREPAQPRRERSAKAGGSLHVAQRCEASLDRPSQQQRVRARCSHVTNALGECQRDCGGMYERAARAGHGQRERSC